MYEDIDLTAKMLWNVTNLSKEIDELSKIEQKLTDYTIRAKNGGYLIYRPEALMFMDIDEKKNSISSVKSIAI